LWWKSHTYFMRKKDKIEIIDKMRENNIEER